MSMNGFSHPIPGTKHHINQIRKYVAEPKATKNPKSNYQSNPIMSLLINANNVVGISYQIDQCIHALLVS